MKKENKMDFRAEEGALVEKKVCFAMLGLCTKESE